MSRFEDSSSPQSEETPKYNIHASVTIALASDLQRLDLSLSEQNKILLVFLDAYETIEDNPLPVGRGDANLVLSCLPDEGKSRSPH